MYRCFYNCVYMCEFVGNGNREKGSSGCEPRARFCNLQLTIDKWLEFFYQTEILNTETTLIEYIGKLRQGSEFIKFIQKNL